MMNQLIKLFPSQLKEAIEIGEKSVIRQHHKAITNIVIAGMGGSGIGGDFVTDLVNEECQYPIIVVKGYKLPAFVSDSSLVIISSYSGNTEETMAVMAQAISADAKLVCIASGGKIIEKAQHLGLDNIQLPSGWPSPRACVGFSLVAQLYVLYKLKIILKSAIEHIKTAADLITFEQEDIMQKAEKIAALLFKKIPVIYITNRSESIALRWRQQINENAKMLCWHHVLPEMNHNELVGWKGKNEEMAVIFLRHKDDQRRNQTRIDITKQIVGQFAATVIEIYAKGQTLGERMMYFVHLGDWVSWYLSQLNNVDASEILVIDHLKAELARVDL